MRNEKTQEEKRAYARGYRLANREKINAGKRAYRARNLEKHRAKDRERQRRDREKRMIYYREWRVRNREKILAQWQDLRLGCLQHYGGIEPACECCGESHLEFLQIDHTAGDGAAHRREMGGSGGRIYRWLKKEGYPAGFRVLCANCNTSRGHYGYCPHKEHEPVDGLFRGYHAVVHDFAHIQYQPKAG